MGSNPIPGAKSLVLNSNYSIGMDKNYYRYHNHYYHCNNNSNSSNSNGNGSNSSKAERDLYAREKRLKYWLGKIEELEEEDKVDVMRYVQYHTERETFALRLIRCINTLLILRRLLDKPFRYCTKEDIHI